MTIFNVAMEQLVRPFVGVPVAPQLRGTSFNPDPGPGYSECKLGGSGGTSTSFSLDETGVNKAQTNNNLKETDRKSTLVRAENENDPTQFVEFCRADKITLSPDTKKDTPQKGSSYDPSGGKNGEEQRSNREWAFKYPVEKTCKPVTKPQKGCK